MKNSIISTTSEDISSFLSEVSELGNSSLNRDYLDSFLYLTETAMPNRPLSIEDRKSPKFNVRYSAMKKYGFTKSSLEDEVMPIRKEAVEFWHFMKTIPTESCPSFLQDSNPTVALAARLKLAGYKEEDNL